MARPAKLSEATGRCNCGSHLGGCVSRAVWITGIAARGWRGERHGERNHDSADSAFDGGHPVVSIRARCLTAAGSNRRMRKTARPVVWEG
jgi:hypothetical protein